jgi:hypothetical protein
MPFVCAGDCDGNGTVSIDELVRAVNIALEAQALDRCPAADADGSGRVTVEELLQAVNAALAGCGASL